MNKLKILRRKVKTPIKNTKEFKLWLRSFLDEDKKLLDELANR